MHVLALVLSAGLVLLELAPWPWLGVTATGVVFLGVLLGVLSFPAFVAGGMVQRGRLDGNVVLPLLLLSGALLLAAALFAWPHVSEGPFDIGDAGRAGLLLSVVGVPLLLAWVLFEVLAARLDRGNRPLVR